MVSESEDDSDDNNNGRRDAKVTDSTEESNSDDQSGPDDNERSQKRTSQAPKVSDRLGFAQPAGCIQVPGPWREEVRRPFVTLT